MTDLTPTADRLLRVTSVLAHAITADEVANGIFEHALQHLGAASVGLWLLDDDQGVLQFAGGAGHQGDAVAMVSTLGLDEDVPASIVLRTGEPVIYWSREERDERWPRLAPLPTSVETVATLPLRARGRVFGCVAMGFAQRGPFEPEEVSFLSLVAEQCAAALDRALLYDSERLARSSLEFLASATNLMVSSLDPDAIVEQLVSLAVPRLADWCAVYVEEDGYLRRMAVAVDGQPDAHEPIGTVPVPVDDADHPLARAFATRELQVLQSIEDELLARLYPSAYQDWIHSIGLAAGVLVPVVARGRPIGVMTFGFRGAYDHRKLYAVTGLAARAGVALEAARRYAQERAAAKMLAAALLPATLPEVPGWDFAARYIPATGDVCGDWYEVDLLPDGAMLLGVGDAAGHGLPAAALMAELRNGARALATVGRRPAEMLGDLSAVLASGDRYGTAIYVRVDPATGDGRWASAGHPPPLLLPSRGAPRFLGGGLAPPLGVPPTPRFEAVVRLGPGDGIMLFTDGVVERRESTLAGGLNRLSAIAAGFVDRPGFELAEAVAEEFCQVPQDDCCVLVVRRLDWDATAAPE